MAKKTDKQIREDLRVEINNLHFMIRGNNNDDILGEGFDDRAALAAIRDIRSMLWDANTNTMRVMRQIHDNLDRLVSSYGVKPELADQR